MVNVTDPFIRYITGIRILQRATKSIITASFALFFLLLETLTRIVLIVYALLHDQIHYSDCLGILFYGFGNDLAVLFYICPVVYLIQSILALSKNTSLTIIFSTIGFAIFAAIMFLSALGEIMFWDEFGTRFNFIAVDYIVYTNEILGTSKESIPIPAIVFSTIIFATVSTKILFKRIQNLASTLNVKTSIINLVFSTVCCTLLFYNHNPDNKLKKTNLYSNPHLRELSYNGIYQLISAFRNNSLDYLQFYPKISNDKAFSIVKNNIQQPNQNFIITNSEGIERFNNGSIAKNYNVVLIIVESLSAEFMQKFGNQQNITPFLDSLTKESIFFTNFYATGTRTVRGIEAVLLSVPPTPGSSIVRRPNSDNLFNASNLFKKQNYDISFIYGGYGYFDNMSNFLSSNNYKFIDRNDLKSSEITFSNVWGVADEDIFKKSIEYIDSVSNNGKPFFSTILTTSNHRPYDFPANRIDLAPGSGRAAAVKYTDYAIKSFIEQAKKKPWFKNTIFVITADHCASSAGKTDLPVHKYHIPLFIYAPEILKPKEVGSLSSQIDIMPTILGILGFNYNTKFFGQDVLNYPTNRAFISTYQMLGYLKNDQLVILAPNKKPQTYNIKNNSQLLTNNDANLVDEAISFYQSAYLLYQNSKMKNN
jgi:phosphoglycerol transferase MdoB-like AlkP superfamily enzyme